MATFGLKVHSDETVVKRAQAGDRQFFQDAFICLRTAEDTKAKHKENHCFVYKPKKWSNHSKCIIDIYSLIKYLAEAKTLDTEGKDALRKAQGVAWNDPRMAKCHFVPTTKSKGASKQDVMRARVRASLSDNIKKGLQEYIGRAADPVVGANSGHFMKQFIMNTFRDRENGE